MAPGPRPELAQHDADTLARFQFGHDVGEKARLLQPDGVLIEAEPDIRAALAHTAQFIAQGPQRPLFEATFRHEEVLVRVDVVEPDDQGGWRAVEVKASNRVKPTHLADLATQLWVMRGTGAPISRAIIRHVSSRIDWRRPDAALVRFQDVDVTQRIERYVRGRPAIVANALATAGLAELSRDMGPHCRRPFSCEFQGHCTARHCVPLIADVSLDRRPDEPGIA